MKTSFITSKPGPKIIKLSSGSTQLSMEFQLLIKTKRKENRGISLLSNSNVVFIMIHIINVKFNIGQHDKIHTSLS